MKFAEDFPNLLKDINLQIQEVQWNVKQNKLKENHNQKHYNQTTRS